MKELEISVIILNYQSWGKLEKCLNSLKEPLASSLIKEVIVVDNASPNDLLDEFRIKYPNYLFVRNTGNNGFANGCNRGAKEARGNAFLFLNPDTIVNSAAIQEMKITKEQFPPIAVLSCQQVNDNGKLVGCGGQFKSFYTLWGWLRSIRRKFVKPKSHCSFSDKLKRMDWVSGSVVLIDKERFDEIGGWCEDYWMYSEDEDLCRRASIHGEQVYLLKEPTIIHSHGGSSRINVRTAALTKSEVRISRHLYFSKYHSGLSLFAIQSILVMKSLTENALLSVLAIPLFFIPKLRLYPVLLYNICIYYLHALTNNTWLSPRVFKTRR